MSYQKSVSVVFLFASYVVATLNAIVKTLVACSCAADTTKQTILMLSEFGKHYDEHDDGHHDDTHSQSLSSLSLERTENQSRR